MVRMDKSTGQKGLKIQQFFIFDALSVMYFVLRIKYYPQISISKVFNFQWFG